MPLLLYNPKKN